MMEAIGMDKVKAIAELKGLKPARVKGTDSVQLTKGSNPRLEVTDWATFEKSLEKRGLAVYESGGWMKIMKALAEA